MKSKNKSCYQCDKKIPEKSVVCPFCKSLDLDTLKDRILYWILRVFLGLIALFLLYQGLVGFKKILMD